MQIKTSERSLARSEAGGVLVVVRGFRFPSTDVTPSRFDPRRDGMEHGLLRCWSGRLTLGRELSVNLRKRRDRLRTTAKARNPAQASIAAQCA